MGKWTRRAAITGGALAGGGLVVGVSLGIWVRPGHRTPKLAPLVTQDGEQLVNAWVKIDMNSQVTAIVPHAEMGQGTHSALAQILAEEMNIPWSQVSVEEAPAHEEFANYALGRGFLLGEVSLPSFLMPTVDGTMMKLMQAMNLQITGGSTSIRFTGMSGVRVAGAAAKEMILESAANEWQVNRRSVTIEDGKVVDKQSGNVGKLAQFANAASKLTPPSKPTLKDIKDFKLVGTSVQRLDIPPKVNGEAKFGIDAIVPDMKYAAIKHAPVFTSSVKSVGQAPPETTAVNLGNAVALVADSYWTADKALRELSVQWTETAEEQISQADIFRAQHGAVQYATEDMEVDYETGDATRILSQNEGNFEQSYEVPYLAHAPMEPLNATADVKGDTAEIWTGTQNPLGVRAAIAQTLQLEPSNVTIHNGYLGGGFGRRASSDYEVEAARISQEIGKPVKLIWSRPEDLQHDQYRPAAVSRFVACLNDAGKPNAWFNAFVEKHEPQEAPLLPYDIPNQKIGSVKQTESLARVPFGPWRSVDHSQHGFFTESFIDELAHLKDQDPLQYRLDLLQHRSRHRKVLEAVADKIGWNSPSKPNQGKGIAVVESFGSIVAEAVEVTVVNRKLQIDRIVCAIDAGIAINPDSLSAQVESGVIYGLTAALYGDITIENGRVKQSNFHDYPMVRIDEAPDIETVIVNSGAPVGGGGEPGTPPLAPALANAIFAASGIRLRQLPFLPLNAIGLLREEAPSVA